MSKRAKKKTPHSHSLLSPTNLVCVTMKARTLFLFKCSTVRRKDVERHRGNQTYEKRGEIVRVALKTERGDLNICRLSSFRFLFFFSLKLERRSSKLVNVIVQYQRCEQLHNSGAPPHISSLVSLETTCVVTLVSVRSPPPLLFVYWRKWCVCVCERP